MNLYNGSINIDISFGEHIFEHLSADLINDFKTFDSDSSYDFKVSNNFGRTVFKKFEAIC